ncbi:MAG TPA: hypothetical protein VND65_06805 [Candidatus Binatia bacterium]|nr:hypothetical protein [Candidatus Binatia bacterium]
MSRSLHTSAAILFLAFLSLARAQQAPPAPRAPRKLSAQLLDPGALTGHTYHNAALGFACQIPEGWVFRTAEMNQSEAAADASPSRVLLAAFSRPPEAKGEDVNSSILIAAEPISSYPGLKDPAQYFGPVTEVAKAQGFDIAEEPYEFSVGAKPLVRGDFEKNVGSRAMHQSTLVMLAKGHAVSFTFIGGTEDEVGELIAGLNFTVTKSK